MSALAETGLFLEGLRCAGCVRKLERVLTDLPGVEEASVHFASERALVRFDPARTAPEHIAAAASELGYDATPYDPSSLELPGRREARAALTRLLVAAFLAANVMMASAALYIGAIEGMAAPVREALRWWVVALSLPAVTWCAAPFWRGAWAGLRQRRIGMDVPVVLGASTAFAASVAGTWADAPGLYLDSAAMIVFLILLGRTLERRARARAGGAMARLAALTPARALRLAPDGAGIEDVLVAELAVGDRVRVAPGQKVPADGRIVAGASEIDESLLSGESLPVTCRTGELVTGGTRNLLAELDVELTAAPDGGTLAEMARLLEGAQAARPNVQTLADRAAAVFAPSVLALAGATLAWGLASGLALDALALRAAAVLIVACPCALGLATPAAVVAAIGRAAQLGILIKRGDALERQARCDTLLLDKTGTISDGRLAVVEVACGAGESEASVLALAAAVEGESRHPIARAIAEAAAARGLAVAELAGRAAYAGRGVEAGEGVRTRVGTRAWLAHRGVRFEPDLDEAADKLAERGLALAFVARGERTLGVLGLADRLREDAAAAVERLRALGLEIELWSGDHEEAVARAAGALRIARFTAAASPQQKLERVQQLRAAGRRVLMVGDGINDAAALAAADVGVAMGRGADVALHAADLVIRAPRLGALTDATALSRLTLRRIRQNLALAIGYNAVAVPLTVAGALGPLGAAVAMSFSSLVVTLNAVRLLGFRGAR